jgi:nickel-type superoxide dismutase maturation protease
MRFQKSSGKPKKLKIFQFRRVVGTSMMPTLKPDKIVVATSLYNHLKPGDIVIVSHQSIEKIKRLKHIRAGEIFIVGDNEGDSLDSRSFGWIPTETIIGKVILPRYSKPEAS